MSKIKQEQNSYILAEERTLLAAQRTFSAWLRTGLAGLASGIAIIRFIIFREIIHQIIGHIVGQILIIWGCSIFIFAIKDYYRITKILEKKVSLPISTSRIQLIIMAGMLITATLLVLWITFT